MTTNVFYTREPMAYFYGGSYVSSSLSIAIIYSCWWVPASLHTRNPTFGARLLWQNR
jgi:hypothetical protein